MARQGKNKGYDLSHISRRSLLEQQEGQTTHPVTGKPFKPLVTEITAPESPPRSFQQETWPIQSPTAQERAQNPYTLPHYRPEIAGEAAPTATTPQAQSAQPVNQGPAIARTTFEEWSKAQESAGNHIETAIHNRKTGDPTTWVSRDENGHIQSAAKLGSDGQIVSANRAFLQQADIQGGGAYLDNPEAGFRGIQSLNAGMNFAEAQYGTATPSAPSPSATISSTPQTPQMNGLGM